MKLFDTTIALVNNLDSVKISFSKMPPFNLLHFQNSENLLFISKFSYDRNTLSNNFIKIGIGYTMKTNVLIEIQPINEKGNFAKLNSFFFNYSFK